MVIRTQLVAFAIAIDTSYFDSRKDKDRIRFTLLISGTHDPGIDLHIPGGIWSPHLSLDRYSGITDGNKAAVIFDVEEKVKAVI
jgi:hypothetical protein